MRGKSIFATVAATAAGQGLEPILKTPEDFRQQWNEDRKTAARLIKQAGLQAQ